MELDRLGPTRRPPRRAIGHQSWRSLLFLHWPIEPHWIRPHLPPGLEVDTWDERAWISLTPFAMRDVRMAGVPALLGLDFLETNLRTYVHAEGADPGVWFFSLDASSRLGVWGARAGFGLPYHYARMSAQREGARFTYRLERARSTARLWARWDVGDARAEAEPGTLDHFLIERYLLHTYRAGRVWTGQVHHRPYPLRTASLLEVDETLCEAAGLPPCAGDPLAHFSDGVDVEVFAPWIRPPAPPRRRAAAPIEAPTRAPSGAPVGSTSRG